MQHVLFLFSVRAGPEFVNVYGAQELIPGLLLSPVFKHWKLLAEMCQTLGL
jgi:hypothetical protein